MYKYVPSLVRHAEYGQDTSHRYKNDYPATPNIPKSMIEAYRNNTFATASKYTLDIHDDILCMPRQHSCHGMRKMLSYMQSHMESRN